MYISRIKSIVLRNYKKKKKRKEINTETYDVVSRNVNEDHTIHFLLKGRKKILKKFLLSKEFGTKLQEK